MRTIIYSGVAILFSIVIYVVNVSSNKTELTISPLSISCMGNVHFNLTQHASTTRMNGSLSMTTLGKERLPLGFSGQLLTENGDFTLHRTLIMTYLYHPENHILELNYANSHISDTDTTPEDVFFHTLLKNNMFMLKLTQLSHNALLVSDLSTPLYVCVSQ